jgi:uncharacterized protein (DUF1330 family)
MTAYWIGRTTILDPSLMGEYSRLGALAAQKHPHRTLVRGGQYRIFEGEKYFERFVIHEFPSMEAAAEFYNSPEYQQAVPLRMKAAAGRCDLVVVEGL